MGEVETDQPLGAFRPRDRAQHLAWLLADMPNAWRHRLRSLRDRTPPASFAEGTRRPVVIVPGVFETWHYLRRLATALNEDGHPVTIVSDLGINRRSIERSADLVWAHLEARDLRDVAIVGHSKGGLVGKQLLTVQDARKPHRIDRLITLASPFHGSGMARLAPTRDLRMFLPGDPVVARLDADTSRDACITSIYPAFDPHIPEGSRVNGARANIEIPIVGHFRILEDERAVDAVVAAVDAP